MAFSNRNLIGSPSVSIGSFTIQDSDLTLSTGTVQEASPDSGVTVNGQVIRDGSNVQRVQASMRNSTTQSVPEGVLALLNFDTSEINLTSVVNLAGNSLDIKQTGTYLILGATGRPSGLETFMAIYRNGSELASEHFYDTASVGSSITIQICTVQQLSFGDVLTLGVIFESAAGTPELFGNANTDRASKLSIMMISD